MNSYAVFLRGINVGGVNIKMAQLRTVLETLPVSRPHTLLATGNITCGFDGTGGELTSLVETALREHFGYQAWVVTLEVATLTRLLEACPYPADSPETHTYVTLSSDPSALDELAGAAADSGAEFTRLGPEALAWLAPVGGTLESPLMKITARAHIKRTTTTRNLRTMLKVQTALTDADSPPGP